MSVTVAIMMIMIIMMIVARLVTVTRTSSWTRAAGCQCQSRDGGGQSWPPGDSVTSRDSEAEYESD